MASSVVFAHLITKSFIFHLSKKEDETDEAYRARASANKDKVSVEAELYIQKLLSDLSYQGIRHTFELKEDWKDTTYSFAWPDIPVIMSQQSFFELLEEGYDVKLKSRHELGGVEAQSADFKTIIDKAQAIVDKFEASLRLSPEGNGFNERCDVHVPGLGLLAMNRTMLLEDSCTDRLQEALDNGWRIIAACPQPDSRRPDYILGKYDPKHELDGTGAERG